MRIAVTIGTSSLEDDAWFIDLGDLCMRAGALVALPTNPPDDSPTAGGADRDAIVERLGAADAAFWIAENTAQSLYESAGLIEGLGAALHVHHLQSVLCSIAPLVRAVIERAGLVRWLLDPASDAIARANRAALHTLVSHQLRRQASSGLGAAPLDEVMAAFDELEAFVNERQGLTTPRGSRPGRNVQRWSVGDETYPTLTELARLAFGGDDGAAIYDTLSGFSHPSVSFGMELRREDAEGAMRYEFAPDVVEKLVRYAVVPFVGSLELWTSYYSTMNPKLGDAIAELVRDFDNHSRA